MRIFIFLLALLLASPAQAIMMIGFGGGGSCVTQSFDVQNTGGGTNTETYDNEQYGQSFKPGVTGDLYSVWFERGVSGTASQIEVRVGTSANLTSYLVRQQYCTVPAGTGYFECEFSTYPTLTSGTTYYIGFGGNIPVNWSVKEGTATYANGQEFYQLSTDWDLTGEGNSWDLNFKTKMCD